MNNFQIEVQDLTLNDYILSSKNIISLSIYNSIDQIGYTLEIIYNDITDIKNKLPIKGGELLTVNAKDIFKNKFKKNFILRQIKRINEPLQEVGTIHMSFISEEGFWLGVNRIYKSYNTSISNIVKEIIPNIIDEKPTTTKHQIVIPGFTGTKALKYLRQFTDNYYVFENNKNFQHSNIQDLLITSSDIYKFQSNNRKDRYYIIDSKEIEVFNTINETYDNIYNNTYKTFNPNSKSFSSTNRNIKEEQSNLKSLGSGENYSDYILESINPKINMLPYFNNNLNYSKIVDLMFNKTYEVLINGDLDIQIGKIFHIQNNLNELLTGLYLITKVAHHINQTDYYTKIEIQKNAYYKGAIKSNVII